MQAGSKSSQDPTKFPFPDSQPAQMFYMYLFARAQKSFQAGTYSTLCACSRAASFLVQSWASCPSLPECWREACDAAALAAMWRVSVPTVCSACRASRAKSCAEAQEATCLSFSARLILDEYL